MDNLNRPQVDVDCTIRARRTLHILLLTTAILVTISVAGQLAVLYLDDFPLRDVIGETSNVDGEQNIPAVFSSLLLLGSAFMAGLIASIQHRSASVQTFHWRVVSAIFTIVGLDEFLSLHERSAEPLRDLLDIEGGPLWFAWVIPGSILAIFAVVFLSGFLRQLPVATRRQLVVGGILLGIGALGVEFFEGAYVSVHGQETLGYMLFTAVEETLEMLGACVSLYALMSYFAKALPYESWRLRITED